MNNTARKSDATFPAPITPGANPKFDKDVVIERLVAENAGQADEINALKRVKSKLRSQINAMQAQIDEMEDRHSRELLEKYDEVRMKLFEEYNGF